MPSLFEFLESEIFGSQMASLSGYEQNLIIDAIQNRLSDKPTNTNSPVRSKRLHDELECIRRIHADDDLLIFYSVCQECKKSEFCQHKIACYECHRIGAYSVILIACGHWEELYKDILPEAIFGWLRKVKSTYESLV
jgi:hypothetical protein